MHHFQNLMAPNLTAIADDFGFDDNERDQRLGGDIALAFFVVGGIASLAIGALTDRPDLVKRRDLYVIVVVFGESACVLTAFVQAYWQLLVLPEDIHQPAVSLSPMNSKRRERRGGGVRKLPCGKTKL